MTTASKPAWLRAARGYEWLATVGTLPKITAVGVADIGIRETPGKDNNPIIIGWAKQVGLEKVFTLDSIAWCGLGMAHWAIEAGKGPIPVAPLWARNWASFGNPVAVNIGTAGTPKLRFEPGMVASLGDVLVFARGTGGHVGQYIAEDPTAYHVLGANQGDAVSIVRVAKDRCIAVRRPPFATALPKSAKPYHVAASGALSKDEA